MMHPFPNGKKYNTHNLIFLLKKLLKQNQLSLHSMPEKNVFDLVFGDSIINENFSEKFSSKRNPSVSGDVFQ